jgi:hypothetical protein
MCEDAGTESILQIVGSLSILLILIQIKFGDMDSKPNGTLRIHGNTNMSLNVRKYGYLSSIQLGNIKSTAALINCQGLSLTPGKWSYLDPDPRTRLDRGSGSPY